MDPQLEFFLEDTFQSVAPTSTQIGRVVIEPDYDKSPEAQDRYQLSQELVQCIQEQRANADQLAAPTGLKIEIPSKYPVLAKYIRSITLHREPAEQPWVEVAPPGNWI